MYKERIPCVIYLDCIKDFDMVHYNTLSTKLERYGFDQLTIQWKKNWLDYCLQMAAVKSWMSKWRLVMSGVFPGAIWRPALISIFIKDTDSEINCTFSKFADNTKLSDTADTPE